MRRLFAILLVASLAVSGTLPMAAQDDEETESIELVDDETTPTEAPTPRPTATRRPTNTPRPTSTPRPPTPTPIAACPSGNVEMFTQVRNGIAQWSITGYVPGTLVTLELQTTDRATLSTLGATADDQCTAVVARPDWLAPGDYRLVTSGTRGNGSTSAVAFLYTLPAETPRAAPPAPPSPPSQASNVEIDVLQWTCTLNNSGERLRTQGTVRNISNATLNFVRVLATWRDVNGLAVSQDESYLTVEHLAPGQQSTFSVSSDYDRRAHSCSVRFSDDLGRRNIRYTTNGR
jgi:hypothetical protein